MRPARRSERSLYGGDNDEQGFELAGHGRLVALRTQVVSG
jgi:hypothetical protein